jgi:hypothetical protein
MYESLPQLGKLSNLMVLHLEGLGRISEEEGDPLFFNLPKLASLTTHGIAFPEFKFGQWIKSMTNLQLLAYDPREVKARELIFLFDTLSHLPKLTELHLLSGIFRENIPALRYLTRCSKIKSLTMDGWYISPNECGSVTDLTQLTQLKFWSKLQRTNKAAWLSKLTNLRSFHNHGRTISCNNIISNMTHLEDLLVEYWTPKNIEKIQWFMPNLTSLTVAYNPDSDDATIFTRLPRLKSLTLAVRNQHLDKTIPECLHVIPHVTMVRRHLRNSRFLEEYETKFLVRDINYP